MENSWVPLGNWLRGRLLRPINQATFVTYFLFVASFAALGPILALWQGVTSGWEFETSNIFFQSMLTYFPAVGCIACLQIIFVEDKEKYRRAFGLFCFAILVTLTILAGALYANKNCLAWWLVCLGSIGALATWWIANARDQNFMDSPLSPIGGGTGDELEGSTEGFDV